ncbi:MAG: serine acetyltransferase [Victivallales bacterium]|nr:serine acetyltransferase [Victivallales bacterium]
MTALGKHPCPEFEARQRTSCWTSEKARQITDALCQTYQDEEGISHIDGANMPERAQVITALEDLLELCFPGYTGRRPVTRAGLEFVVGDLVNEVFETLCPQVRRALAYRCLVECCEGCDCTTQAEEAVLALFEELPRLRDMLKEDVAAALDGDPAAHSSDEVIISYPGLKAIAVQRIAHILYVAKIPLIPRVMGEYAHTETGIDIHPGATIGRAFFIDHGTGVVIGETAVIGDSVKLYQGITLGALSFPKDACGKLIKGAKRHPNIEDNVTIYAGATILGDITVGSGSVIGGNVWLTETVPPNTKITIAPPNLSIRQRRPAPPAIE